MPQIKLTHAVVQKLLAQDPSTEQNGGFQRLTIKLQRQVNPQTGVLTVDASDMAKIERYRNDYGQGGWQDLFDQIIANS